MMEDAVEGDVHEHVWALIPWFVNGRLSNEDALAVEAHLTECALCREECAAQARIHDAVRDEDPIAFATEASYRKLAGRLDSGGASQPREKPRWAQWLLAAVIVESMALVSWGAWAWHGNRTAPAAPYVTLSSAGEAASSATRPLVRVVFTPQSTLADVQSLLHSVDARVVDGPTESGVYTLSLASGEVSDEDRVGALRASALVRFAEPVYTTTGTSP